MIRAYQEIYLSRAQAALGDAFDYAINVCNILGADFVKLFTASTVSKRLENGEPAYLSGKSGIEIVLDIVLEAAGRQLEATQQERMERSREYWIGWAVAYYQWYSGKTFETICKRISYEDIRNVYGVLHEADPSKAADVFSRMMNSGQETNLAVQRKKRGLSQSQLAKAADISIRSIQLYEQRKADIGKAQYNHLTAIAKVLGCTVDDILE